MLCFTGVRDSSGQRGIKGVHCILFWCCPPFAAICIHPAFRIRGHGNSHPTCSCGQASLDWGPLWTDFGGHDCTQGEGLSACLRGEGRTEREGGERNKSKHELGGFSKPAEGLEKDRLWILHVLLTRPLIWRGPRKPGKPHWTWKATSFLSSPFALSSLISFMWDIAPTPGPCWREESARAPSIMEKQQYHIAPRKPPDNRQELLARCCSDPGSAPDTG